MIKFCGIELLLHHSKILQSTIFFKVRHKISTMFCRAFPILDIQYLESCSHFAKTIDTRLKEIKLTRTRVTEDESKTVLEVPRSRKKDKTKDQNRSKQKVQDKARNYRKKNRITRKDERWLKDEFDDLRIVEEKFFETVAKVISDDLPRIPAMFLASEFSLHEKRLRLFVIILQLEIKN